MTDPQDLMFRGLCAVARQSGWRPIGADHPAIELYGDDARQLAQRINRIGVRLYLAGEEGFEAFGEIVEADPAGAAGCVAARAAIDQAATQSTTAAGHANKWSNR